MCVDAANCGGHCPECQAAQLRSRAIALYAPPFRYAHGYVYDSRGHMVADQGGSEEPSSLGLRVRGWGRIGGMPDSAALQDEVGALMAELLTANWPAMQESGATDLRYCDHGKNQHEICVPCGDASGPQLLRQAAQNVVTECRRNGGPSRDSLAALCIAVDGCEDVSSAPVTLASKVVAWGAARGRFVEHGVMSDAHEADRLGAEIVADAFDVLASTPLAVPKLSHAKKTASDADFSTRKQTSGAQKASSGTAGKAR